MKNDLYNTPNETDIYLQCSSHRTSSQNQKHGKLAHSLPLNNRFLPRVPRDAPVNQ